MFLLNRLEKGSYVILMDNIEDLVTDEQIISDEEMELFLQAVLQSPFSVKLILTSRTSKSIWVSKILQVTKRCAY